jgi:trk system potassium uptake protein TrkA
VRIALGIPFPVILGRSTTSAVVMRNVSIIVAVGGAVKIVILGCGRVGARVAAELAPDHEVTVVDWNPSAFERLPSSFQGETYAGNGIDVDTLRAVAAGHADVFVAVTNGDNRNLMAAQIARQLGARQVLVRVYDAERSRIFEGMGMTTISPTILGAQRLFAMVEASREEF